MITEKEAIEYFKSLRKIFCEDYLKKIPKDSIAYQATLKEKSFYDMAIRSLEQLKEQKKEQKRWIPFDGNGDLPEDLQRVLVTIVNYDGYKIVRVAQYRKWRDVFKICENSEEWKVGEKGLLAWRPLPYPYD